MLMSIYYRHEKYGDMGGVLFIENRWMSLTDAIMRTAQPHRKAYKMSDEKGMFLYITPLAANYGV